MDDPDKSTAENGETGTTTSRIRAVLADARTWAVAMLVLGIVLVVISWS